MSCRIQRNTKARRALLLARREKPLVPYVQYGEQAKTFNSFKNSATLMSPKNRRALRRAFINKCIARGMSADTAMVKHFELYQAICNGTASRAEVKSL